MLRRELLARFLMAMRQDRIAEAEALIRKFTDSGEVTSAALLVRQGRVEMNPGRGKAGPRTPFQREPITRPMTARGAMVLPDRGELTLDDRLRKCLAKFTGNGREGVTIRHLLTHTSGLPD